MATRLQSCPTMFDNIRNHATFSCIKNMDTPQHILLQFL